MLDAILTVGGDQKTEGGHLRLSTAIKVAGKRSTHCLGQQHPNNNVKIATASSPSEDTKYRSMMTSENIMTARIAIGHVILKICTVNGVFNLLRQPASLLQEISICLEL